MRPLPLNGTMAQYQENISSPSKAHAVRYGELIVLGSKDFLSYEARMKSHFTLCQRPKANGVKPSTVHCNPQSIRLRDQHRVSYLVTQMGRLSTVSVKYVADSDTDMFQIGRSTESPIDFVVTDTEADGQTSPISRFACRIICQRSPPYTARIYAAGFDCSKNIFLGENADKWKTRDGQMDGLTTNGVLVMHPPLTQDSQTLWREISVCGNVFALRETSSAQQRGRRVVHSESQELVDGSMINLSGVTLLWRTAEGLARTPIIEHLEIQRGPELYAGIPCFVYKFKKQAAGIFNGQQGGVQQQAAGILNGQQNVLPGSPPPTPAADRAPRPTPSPPSKSQKAALPRTLQDQLAMGFKLNPVKVFEVVKPPKEEGVLVRIFENIPFIPDTIPAMDGDEEGHAVQEHEWK